MPTPAWHAPATALLRTELTHAEIAQRLGVTPKAVKSLGQRLRQKGLLDPRPLGGDQRRKAMKRETGVGEEVDVSGEDPGPGPPQAPVPDQQVLLWDTVMDVVRRIEALEAQVLQQARTPSRPPSQVPAPQGPHERYRFYLPTALMDAIRQRARSQGRDPSQLIQEWAWKGLRNDP
jgi:hypothetical protein